MHYSTDPDRDEGSHAAKVRSDLLVRRAERYARRAETADLAAAEALSFRRGAGRYGIALAELREIRPLRRLCRIPGSSPVVPGMFHHRGEVLSAHDLAAFVAATPVDPPSFVLVVEHEGRRLGLLADELLDTLRVTAAGRRAVPVAMGDRAACFSAVTGEDVLLLEVGALFTTKRFFCAF